MSEPTQHVSDVVGYVHSPYAEKFGIPRQPRLVDAPATIEICRKYADPSAFVGLEQASHIWVLWQFHANQNTHATWQRTVRPPRLGGNKRLGVFATRSGFRPNGIGMSVCELRAIETQNGVVLHLSGVDMLNGTPVLDIKPYIPYVDYVPEARCAWAAESPVAILTVHWEPEALRDSLLPEQQVLVEQVLAQDPRPAYQRDKALAERMYGVSLFGFNIQFKVLGRRVVIVAVSSPLAVDSSSK